MHFLKIEERHMQSKKRYTETNIWDDPVFMNLTPQQKLCWYFLNDRCDNIGGWTPNPKLIAFTLDIDGDPKQFLDDFLQVINSDKELIQITPSGDWIIIDFVKFQYCHRNPLNPNNKAHKSYLDLIEGKNLLSWFAVNCPKTLPESYLNKGKKDLSETSPRPLRDPLETHKDKDKEKDKEMDTDTDMDKAQEMEAFKEFAP